MAMKIYFLEPMSTQLQVLGRYTRYLIESFATLEILLGLGMARILTDLSIFICQKLMLEVRTNDLLFLV